MVQITKFAKDVITITREDSDYDEWIVYEKIKADVQLRAYNIRDFSTESMETESTEKYYIMIHRKYINIRPWDFIKWSDDLWQTKTLLVTSLSMERFLSRKNLIEIRAKDYVIDDRN